MDDDDKILYHKIGSTEITIDKILSNLLVVDEYVTFRNVIMQENDKDEGNNLNNSKLSHMDNDDLFSNHSLTVTNKNTFIS